MGVDARMSEVAVNFVHKLVDMFELLCLFMNIRYCHASPFREIRFPEAVGPDHLQRSYAAGGGELEFIIAVAMEEGFLFQVGDNGVQATQGDPRYVGDKA